MKGGVFLLVLSVVVAQIKHNVAFHYALWGALNFMPHIWTTIENGHTLCSALYIDYWVIFGHIQNVSNHL